MVEDIRADLREALKRTATTLKRSGVPFALCGGYALWARGAPESEHDVDFVVAEQDAERAAHYCAESGLEILPAPEDWLFKIVTDGVVVDVLHRLGGQPADSATVARADSIEVLSIEMPVLYATDVMTAKLVALTEHFCDFSRLLPVARALREQLDWAHIAKEVEHNPFADAFLHLVRRLDLVNEP